MAWHPTLDDMERRQAEPFRRAGSKTPDLPLLGDARCWCGEKFGHPWPGKANGAAHPRETAD